MAHEPGHKTEYSIVGTDQIYTGRVVQIGSKLYSTVGGAKEGFSVRVQTIKDTVDKNANPLKPIEDAGAAKANPIVRKFYAGNNPTYYNSRTGERIPTGTPLHSHADGTVMTMHSMGPNDNSVIVTTIPPIGEQQNINGNGNGTDGDTGGGTGGGVGPGPQPNPNPGMSGQSNPSGGKSGPGQGPSGGY